MSIEESINVLEHKDEYSQSEIIAATEIAIDTMKKYLLQKKNNKEKNNMRKFEFVSRIIDSYEKLGLTGENTEEKLPQRSTKKSAGYDFFNPEYIEIPPYKLGDKPTLVPTGVKVCMPDNEFLMLVNRSSNPKKKNLVIPNSLGIIDADYYDNPDNEGEIMFAFYNLGTEPVVLEAGDKLGQGIFMKYEVTDDDTAEGERKGGFGSTGR